MKNRLLLWLLLLGAGLSPMIVRAQVVVEKSTEIVTISDKQYYMHHVKNGETLYSIARVYEVTEDEIRKLNPEIEELGLQAEMVIGIPVVKKEEPQATPQVTVVRKEQEPKPVGDTINPVLADLPISPDDEICDGYVIHTVKEAEKTKRLLRRWNVTEEEFRQMNPSVGTRVFVGQKVLIPVKNLTKQGSETVVNPLNDTIPEGSAADTTKQQLDSVVDGNKGEFVLPEEKPEVCYASPENADRQYHVALLVPLYLNEIEKLDLSKAKIEKTKSTRAMKFLQFYEGFMMAADSLTRYHGLRLDLTVIDVSENVAGAEAAVSQLQNEEVDLIIGPFFSKSFAVVQEFAKSKDILVVNPMSERESIIVDAPNVVKLKPSAKSMVDNLVRLLNTQYPKAKVTFITENNPRDSVMVEMLEQALQDAVPPEVVLTNAEMVELITKESRRRKMGKRVLSTLEVEGQIFSTKALSENPDGISYFDNPFQRIKFAEIESFKKELSAGRDNVLVAYGKDLVFATKILNTVNKSTKKYPITLIGLPDWEEFENLLVLNLLNMNAVYFNPHFVDYNDSIALQFVDGFRSKYQSEPMDYAFEGFDVGWYFLNALMQFGPHAAECLPYYHPALLSSRYYFNKDRYEDGLENRYWNIYQFDNSLIELKPIRIWPEEE